VEKNVMASYTFDDHNVRWNTLGDFKRLWYWILNIDEHLHIVDILFRRGLSDALSVG
jgi:hypothetical protein